MKEQRWLCNDCDQISLTSEQLVAQHPFKHQEIFGCPHCRGVDLQAACWACDEPASGAGLFPGEPEDYRTYCHRHSPETAK